MTNNLYLNSVKNNLTYSIKSMTTNKKNYVTIISQLIYYTLNSQVLSLSQCLLSLLYVRDPSNTG